MTKVTVTVGHDDLNFDVSTEDFNKYINSQMPNNKVAPAFNFLSQTVVKEDKEKFKQLLVDNNTPRGMLVVQVAGVLAEEFGAGVEISVKKPSSSPKESAKTDTASS